MTIIHTCAPVTTTPIACKGNNTCSPMSNRLPLQLMPPPLWWLQLQCLICVRKLAVVLMVMVHYSHCSIAIIIQSAIIFIHAVIIQTDEMVVVLIVVVGNLLHWMILDFVFQITAWSLECAFCFTCTPILRNIAAILPELMEDRRKKVKKLFIGEEEGRCMTGRTQQWQDLNLWALQSTCSNAQLNGISEQLHWCWASWVWVWGKCMIRTVTTITTIYQQTHSYLSHHYNDNDH